VKYKVCLSNKKKHHDNQIAGGEQHTAAAVAVRCCSAVWFGSPALQVRMLFARVAMLSEKRL
jgi:hypothetical protein